MAKGHQYIDVSNDSCVKIKELMDTAGKRRVKAFLLNLLPPKPDPDLNKALETRQDETSQYNPVTKCRVSVKMA